MLLEYDAKVNQADNRGATPLHYASYWNNTGMVKLLLDKGADVNKQMTIGKTPLDLAETEEVKKLLKDKDGKTKAELELIH